MISKEQYAYEKRVRIGGLSVMVFLAFAPLAVDLLSDGRAFGVTSLAAPLTYCWIFYFFGAGRVFTGLAVMMTRQVSAPSEQSRAEMIAISRALALQMIEDVEDGDRVTLTGSVIRDMTGARASFHLRSQKLTTPVELSREVSDALQDLWSGDATIYHLWFSDLDIPDIELSGLTAHRQLADRRCLALHCSRAKERRILPERRTCGAGLLDRIERKDASLP